MNGIDSPIAQVITVATSTTLPAPVTLTGTVSSAGLLVTGTGTKFLSEVCYSSSQISLKVKYLWDSAHTELREIDTVIDDTHLMLKVAFTSSLSGATLQVPDPAKQYREISLAPSGSGCVVCTANKAAVTMNPDVMMNFESENGLPPIALNGATNAIQVTYQ